MPRDVIMLFISVCHSLCWMWRRLTCNIYALCTCIIFFLYSIAERSRGGINRTSTRSPPPDSRVGVLALRRTPNAATDTDLPVATAYRCRPCPSPTRPWRRWRASNLRRHRPAATQDSDTDDAARAADRQWQRARWRARARHTREHGAANRYQEDF